MSAWRGERRPYKVAGSSYGNRIWIAAWRGEMGWCRIGVSNPRKERRLGELFFVFQDVEDPRPGNAKLHDLHEMLVLALLAMLTGGRTCVDMEGFGRERLEWLREFLTLENGIPSHDTFSRLFRTRRVCRGRCCAWRRTGQTDGSIEKTRRATAGATAPPTSASSAGWR